jgi:DNA repair exonuclease SbcCD ATPase subunit
MSDKLTEAVFYVKAEVERAKRKHPGDFHSPHEGYAILLEEVDELKAEVWKSKHDKAAMRTEAIHVAAMAVRFVVELCDERETFHEMDKRIEKEMREEHEEDTSTMTIVREVSEAFVKAQQSAQNCGCDMGCKPRPHYCERHAHLELCK